MSRGGGGEVWVGEGVGEDEKGEMGLPQFVETTEWDYGRIGEKWVG